MQHGGVEREVVGGYHVQHVADPRLHERAVLLQGLLHLALLQPLDPSPKRQLRRGGKLRTDATQRARDLEQAARRRAGMQELALETEREDLIPGELRHPARGSYEPAWLDGWRGHVPCGTVITCT
jgi:hypothetical protein